jgi:hypothetical protein
MNLPSNSPALYGRQTLDNDWNMSNVRCDTRPLAFNLCPFSGAQQRAKSILNYKHQIGTYITGT